MTFALSRFQCHHYRLYCASITLEQFTTELSTVAHMYSAEILRANIMRMQAAFAILEQLICFAAKANGNLAMLSTYATAGWDSMWLPAAICTACTVRQPTQSSVRSRALATPAPN